MVPEHMTSSTGVNGSRRYDEALGSRRGPQLIWVPSIVQRSTAYTHPSASESYTSSSLPKGRIQPDLARIGGVKHQNYGCFLP